MSSGSLLYSRGLPYKQSRSIKIEQFTCKEPLKLEFHVNRSILIERLCLYNRRCSYNKGVVYQDRQQDKGRPLPKFGEWDVNNPASADGFTVIFSKARDEKKSPSMGNNTGGPKKNDGTLKPDPNYDFPKSRKWFCCG